MLKGFPKKLNKQRKPLAGLMVLIVAFLFLTHQGPFKPAKKELVSETPVIEEKNRVTRSGKVKAQSTANLTFQTYGLVTWVGVKEGDYVKKWQGIASLDRRDLEKRLSKAMNLYLTNRWDFEQLQDDYKEKKDRYLLTDSDRRILDKAQFSLNNAVSDVDIADL